MACLEDVKLEHLTPKQRELAEIVGLNGFINLVRILGGADVYIPVESAVLRQSIHEEIYKRSQSENYKNLAAEYDVSLKTIYEIVRKYK